MGSTIVICVSLDEPREETTLEPHPMDADLRLIRAKLQYISTNPRRRSLSWDFVQAAV